MFTAIGCLGLLAAPTAGIWVWVILLGVGAGGAVILAFARFAVLRHARWIHEFPISTAQSFGYGVAAVGPVLIGLLHDSTGGWAVPLIVMTALSGVGLIAGLLASRDRHVRAD